MSSSSSSTDSKHQVAKNVEAEDELPRAKVIIIMSCIIAIMFLVALDRTIIGVAIPTITDQFGSIDDIGWYGSAYMLFNATLQLLFGRIYKFSPVKITFIISIIIFEIGSAICGAAPNSVALIIGRAIAGSGSAGIFSGTIQIMLHIIPLRKRPMWQALFALVSGVSSALGPLIGGAFTEKVSWRWCFYINLPFGGLVIVAIVFLLDFQNRPGFGKAPEGETSRLDMIKRLDPVGFLLLVPCITCLLLALQYGGFVYPWSNARLIVSCVIFGITLLAFIVSQWYFDENALLSPSVFLQRSVQGAFWYIFLLYSSMIIMIYYIPIWFQVVKGSAALESSYQTLPSILSLVAAAIIAGVLARKTGHYTPQMMISPMLSAVGVGLMTT